MYTADDFLVLLYDFVLNHEKNYQCLNAHPNYNILKAFYIEFLDTCRSRIIIIVMPHYS